MKPMPDIVRNTPEDELLEIFRRSVKKRNRARVRPDARLQADLDLDSLGVVTALLAAEEELGVRIFPIESETGEIRTIQDVINFVRAAMENE
jgi:acyl carrier protein